MSIVPYQKKPALYNKRLYMVLFLLLAVLCAGCSSVSITSNMSGMSACAALAVKDFIIAGPVMVYKTETHRAGPMGFIKSVEGSKVTYNDLILEAAGIKADDIIDVKIDVGTVAKTSFVEWLTGWSRTYTYTGTALAIIYVNKPRPETPEENEALFNFISR